MENNQVILSYLAGIGAALGLGNLLISEEPLTIRLAIGRMLLGSGASVAAGSIYILFPTIHPLALIGLASLTGLAGAAWVEVLFKKKMESLVAKSIAKENENAN